MSTVIIKVYPAGFELNHEVPADEASYNALAPKRTSAMWEDAVANVEYRGVFPEFRDALAAYITKETGIERLNTGTAEDPIWESDGKHLKRAIAASGLSREDFIAKHTPAAQLILDGIKFDPSTQERKGDGPKVGVNDLKLAVETLARGTDKAAQVAAMLGTKLGREVLVDEKSLARAFGDYRRQKAEEAAAAQRSEFGL